MKQLALFSETEPEKIIRCPNCRYSPVYLLPRRGVYGVPNFFESEDRDWPVLMQLEFFDVLSCDEGNIMCRECACEFNIETGKAAVYREMPLF